MISFGSSSHPGHDGVRSELSLETRHALSSDPVSRVLKWVLLAVAVGCLGMIVWASTATYTGAPPDSDQFVAPDGAILMSNANIVAGKSGFQKADLMDYGSLYGMGSYFGEDYTATNLVQLATLTEENLAKARFEHSFAELDAEQRAAINQRMQADLRGVDLTQTTVSVPTPLASAISTLQASIASDLLRNDYVAGYSRARSLDAQTARQTADFLIYSSITTVAHRPNSNVSWTQNWPYEPLVGNTPTNSTFMWTWISYCFVFFLFGAVLFIYQVFLSDPDKALMDPVLVKFRAKLHLPYPAPRGRLAA